MPFNVVVIFPFTHFQVITFLTIEPDDEVATGDGVATGSIAEIN